MGRRTKWLIDNALASEKIGNDHADEFMADNRRINYVRESGFMRTKKFNWDGCSTVEVMSGRDHAHAGRLFENALYQWMMEKEDDS